MNTVTELMGECDRKIKNLTYFLDKQKADYLDGEICDVYYQSITGFHETHIKMLRLEKTIYNALSKNNREVFPLFLEKYDELMGVSFDISSKSVNDGVVLEVTHLNYCINSLEQREYIKGCCEYGEHRTEKPFL